LEGREPLPGREGRGEAAGEATVTAWLEVGAAQARLRALRWGAVLAVPVACCTVLPVVWVAAGPTVPVALIVAGEVTLAVGMLGWLVAVAAASWARWAGGRDLVVPGWLAGACALVAVGLVAGAGLVAPRWPAIAVAVVALAVGCAGWALDRRWRRQVADLNHELVLPAVS
jgi:hypothetical protein